MKKLTILKSYSSNMVSFFSLYSLIFNLGFLLFLGCGQEAVEKKSKDQGPEGALNSHSHLKDAKIIEGTFILENELLLEEENLLFKKGAEVFVQNHTLRVTSKNIYFEQGVKIHSFLRKDQTSKCDQDPKKGGSVFLDALKVTAKTQVQINLFGQSAAGSCEYGYSDITNKPFGKTYNGADGGGFKFYQEHQHHFDFVFLKSLGSEQIHETHTFLHWPDPKPLNWDGEPIQVNVSHTFKEGSPGKPMSLDFY